jgi:DDE superfamily endonuclease
MPGEIIAVLLSFAPLFSRSVFEQVQVLVIGAILAPGKRTVTSALRAMGLHEEKHFQNDHRVLNRARWSSRQASRILLGLLVRTFAPSGPLVVGIDETLERRQGSKIAAKGIYRDAARSSKSFFVKSSGLRWISLMLLAPIAWAGRTWALPFFSVLAPSQRYDQERGRRHKSLSDWARQMLKQLRRWLPERLLVLVADSGYAALTFLDACGNLKNPVTVVTRLRLDAALYEPAPPRKPKQNGRPRKKGKRLPTLQQVLDNPTTVWQPIQVARWYSQGRRTVEIVSAPCIWFHGGMAPVPIRWVLLRDPEGKFQPQALLCTDLASTPEQIVSWFVLRWQLETTFQEVRTHLGVETQRQWSALAIGRTTPALLGLFSLVTLPADRQFRQGRLSVRQAAWYVKERPTFSDAMACVRRQLWSDTAFCLSSFKTDIEKVQQALWERFADMLCYAA